MSKFRDVFVVPQGKGMKHDVYITNFGINRSELKSGHRAALDRYVVPILQLDGSTTILGMASRTGTPEHNLALSRKRAQTVLNYLKQKSGASGSQFRLVIGTGEILPTLLLVDDETEDSFYRTVGISVSEKKIPPPPPPPPRKADSRKYECVNESFDKGFYESVNNAEHWEVKGASGGEYSLHLFIKGAEEALKQNTTYMYRNHSSRALLEFYKSPQFRAWYLDGLCGLEERWQNGRLEHAMRYIQHYNIAENRKGVDKIRKKIIEHMSTMTRW